MIVYIHLQRSHAVSIEWWPKAGGVGPPFNRHGSYRDLVTVQTIPGTPPPLRAWDAPWGMFLHRRPSYSGVPGNTPSSAHVIPSAGRDSLYTSPTDPCARRRRTTSQMWLNAVQTVAQRLPGRSQNFEKWEGCSMVIWLTLCQKL